MQAERVNRIIVFIPKDSITGGPECLHQFVGMAHRLNFPVFIAYYTGYVEILHEEYFNERYSKHVSATLIRKIQVNAIDSGDYLIFPEVEIPYLKPYRNYKIAIWWLSIDNAIGPVRLALSKRWLYRFLSGCLSQLLKLGVIHNYQRLQLLYPIISTQLGLQGYDHFCQSFYAYQFFNGILPRKTLLGDFTDLPLDCLKESKPSKENQVLYNPKKGYEIMEWFIHQFPEISWIPIQNMTKEEVTALMLRSKVYVDFGNHPGKDRIPREATLCGCIVITNREGSAAFFEDVGIAENYKFLNPLSEYTEILALIHDIFINYPNHRNQQWSYYETVQNEFDAFQEQVSRILRSILD
jgi:hypothetical protein